MPKSIFSFNDSQVLQIPAWVFHNKCKVTNSCWVLVGWQKHASVSFVHSSYELQHSLGIFQIKTSGFNLVTFSQLVLPIQWPYFNIIR